MGAFSGRCSVAWEHIGLWSLRRGFKSLQRPSRNPLRAFGTQSVNGSSVLGVEVLANGVSVFPNGVAETVEPFSGRLTLG